MNNEKFYEIPVRELENAVKLICDDWMLITARDGEGVNAMTASWGNLGVLWNRPVCTCFIRPQRHTYGLIEKEERISIAFMPEGYRAALSFCGSHSGRDCDKLKEAGLTSATLDGVPVIAEAETLLICRKLYFGDLCEEGFTDRAPLSNYKDGDFHRFYVCEIEKAYKRR